MRLPSLIDYQEAVQSPHVSFVDPTLRLGRPRLTPLQAPAVASGGFALTFDMSVNGQRFAVRCFHKPGNRLQERYAEIANFIRAKRSGMNFLIDVNYIPAGIRVHDTVLPVVRMPWVAGLRLNEWVEDHLDRPRVLDAVRHQIQDAARKLRSERAAHGDLQHGNILVDSGNNIHLVDYDGMYVPPLHDFGAAENGHRNYQHPGRGSSYDHQLDDFSAFVIDISLNGVAHDPTLWDEFNTGENLLFSADDYANPGGSPVFRRLSQLSPLAEQVRRLANACTADFASVPAVLAGDRPAGATVRPAPVRHRPAGPVPVLAHDRNVLYDRVGDEVTVVGRVASTRVIEKYGRLTTFINFGNYRRGDFTIVAFNHASRELRATFGARLQGLAQSWVSLNGLLTLYDSKWSDDLTPQIELGRARSLRLLGPDQVETLIAHAKATPEADIDPPEDTSWASAPPPTPRLGSPMDDRTGDREQRLGALYSTPGFTQQPVASQAPSPPPAATPPPPLWPQARPIQMPARASWWERVRRRLGL